MMIPAGEIFFVDTNILLIATDESREHHENARKLFSSLIQKGYSLGLCGQVLREYMVVVSRPKEVNGLGLSSSQAVHNINQFRQRTIFFDETIITSEILQHLAVKKKFKGKRIHDANLAAIMKQNRIKYIITENPKDFAVFDEIICYSINQISQLSQQ